MALSSVLKRSPSKFLKKFHQKNANYSCYNKSTWHKGRQKESIKTNTFIFTFFLNENMCILVENIAW